MTDFRYLVDTTKAAMEAHPGFHVIIDSHAGNQIVALCPITEGNEPVCEGQFSFAPIVQRGLENQANARATLANISALVRNAFSEGRESTSGTDRHYGDRAWDNSRSKRNLRRIMLGTDQMPEHPMETVSQGNTPLTDAQIVTSPDHSPLDRIIAHGRLAHKDGW